MNRNYDKLKWYNKSYDNYIVLYKNQIEELKKDRYLYIKYFRYHPSFNIKIVKRYDEQIKILEWHKFLLRDRKKKNLIKIVFLCSIKKCVNNRQKNNKYCIKHDYFNAKVKKVRSEGDEHNRIPLEIKRIPFKNLPKSKSF